MKRLFVAPPEAQQFEITQGWYGTPVPESLAPFVIWVVPLPGYGTKNSKPDCPHDVAFAVIRESLTPQQLQRGIGTCDKVCQCVGRFIE